jgi:predicted alpha-1,2-mannosidase
MRKYRKQGKKGNHLNKLRNSGRYLKINGVKMKSFYIVLMFLLFQSVNLYSQKDFTKYIDPKIGSVGQLLEPTRPTVHQPNQPVRMYPVRKDYLDDQISWFPMSIVSHRGGELFGIKPANGIAAAGMWNKRMPYDQDLEIIKPWYYCNPLIEDNIKVEFTPGAKTGFFRFTFTNKDVKTILLKLFNEGKWEFIEDNVITGTEEFSGMKAYVYGVFNVNGSTGALIKESIAEEKSAQGKNASAFISFGKNTPAGIQFKYGFSFISIEQAEINLNMEIIDWNFDTLMKKNIKLWQKNINQIEVEGGTEASMRSFYSALYRCNERMVDINEYGKYFSGYDKKVHTTDKPFFVDDWVWDTYLALHPLRMILNPVLEKEMLQSYVTMYKQSGWVPTFPLVFGDNPCMNGFHSTIVFLDAYRKGIKDFDVAVAYEGAKKNALEATMIPWRNGPKCSLDDFYYKNGYFPALHPGEKERVSEVHGFEKRQSVAITLGHSYDDWALAQFAKELSNTKDYELFSKRGENYKNVWRAEKEMMWPKDSSGKWIEINPKIDGGMGGRDYYDENNGWTYLWQVQQDVSGLTELLGGKKGLEKKLDQLFREDLGMSKYQFQSKFPDATGLVGQFSMGNEPSFHIPYLYNYTNAPWKTQKHIRFLLDVWFKDNIFGIPGDEDGGGMSAFVVFSMMGFYPVTPGIPVYTIGSPSFKKVTINLPDGKKFKIIANNCSKENKYIQKARFNGKELNSPWFTHEDLIKGGTLELEMDSRPNMNWGISK